MKVSSDFLTSKSFLTALAGVAGTCLLWYSGSITQPQALAAIWAALQVLWIRDTVARASEKVAVAGVQVAVAGEKVAGAGDQVAQVGEAVADAVSGGGGVGGGEVR